MIFSNIYNVRDLFESAIQSPGLVWWLIKSISFFFFLLCVLVHLCVCVFFLSGSCLFVLLILKINMFLFSSLGGHLS